MLFPEPTAVLRDADYFRQQHLFIFSDVKEDQMGQLLSSTYRVRPQSAVQGK
jgi:hypothetical protein